LTENLQQGVLLVIFSTKNTENHLSIKSYPSDISGCLKDVLSLNRYNCKEYNAIEKEK